MRASAGIPYDEGARRAAIVRTGETWNLVVGEGRRVLVNGVTTLVDGEATDALPGFVLRSGRDTDTVLV